MIFSPDEAEAYVDSIWSELSESEILTNRRYRRLQEIWCAAHFARGYEGQFQPDRIQIDIELEDEQREFDFHLLLHEERIPFQVTEVMDPDRTRDREYKTLAKEERVEMHSLSDSLDSHEASLLANDAIARKNQKLGADNQDLHLLLYVNCNVYQLDWDVLSRTCAEQAKSFASVWAVTGSTFTCIYGGTRWRNLANWYPITAAV